MIDDNDKKMIREMIQDIVTQNAKDNQFALSYIPVHSHTGSDAPHVDAGNLDFAQPYFKLPDRTTVPTAKIKGAIASVNGKLYIYDGSNWTVVGTQV